VAPTRRLVLASASPARRRLLEQAGFAPEIRPSDVDEDAATAPTVDELVRDLAVRKAEAVAAAVGDAIVVGCDSVLDVDGEPQGKPSGVDEARARLVRLRGRDAVLRTGHCVIDTRTTGRAVGVAATTVRFGDYDDRELDAYLATGEALAVAGSFTLDGRSAPFVDGGVGDPGNVIGLSLPLLRRLLAEIGVAIVDLWV